MIIIKYTVDVHDVVDEIDRLQDAPDERAVLALDGVLTRLYARSQMAVHVITGSLEASGKIEMDFDDAGHVWSGDISYGGAAPGAVHDPVIYAYFEYQRKGPHSAFIDVIEEGGPEFGAAVLAAVRGDV